MANQIFKVCARYTHTSVYNDKLYAQFAVVGTGTLINIPIVGEDYVVGAFYLIDVYPRHYNDENYLSFRVRCELTLPKIGESLA